MESATERPANHRQRTSAPVLVRRGRDGGALATFLGVCKVKDDNIVQAMQQAQADRLDHWNFYQARNIREEVAAAAPPNPTRERRGGGSAGGISAGHQCMRRLVADQAAKKEELRVQAEQDQRTPTRSTTAMIN